MVDNQHLLGNDAARVHRTFQPIGGLGAPAQINMAQKPQLNQMAQEFTPHAVAKKQQMLQQQQQQHQQLVQGFAQAGYPVNQQAALQAAMMNPATLQAMLQNQNPHFLHHIQQQQLQQLQQLHQQNLRLAAAFNQNQMGIFNATSALMQQMPGQDQNSRGKIVAEETNNDFEHFPTREDVSPSPPLPVAGVKKQKQKTKDYNKDSAFERSDDISDDSSDSNGSSYLTMELDESEIPEREILEQICRQVEEYLSDDYLATDKYLLRQLRSKSEGYLSVKLLTSFKKIKKLTRDWRVTAHALKLSAIVELSNDGHRVKRKANLPENLRRGRTMTSILAIRVPDDWATLEAITNIFSAYGNITLARVLRPGRAIPPDLRNYATQIPDMGATTCAVVDFDSTDSAHECCRGLRDKNLRGMRIALLGPRIRRTLYKAEKKKIPENRQQRRVVAPTLNQPQHKNVSKEEGLKIIQSYFHNQVKPTPDDPIDFPPLSGNGSGGNGVASAAGNAPFFEQMASQMSVLQIAPKVAKVNSTVGQPKWGPAPTPPPTKPTMSQIVAQNAAPEGAREQDCLSDNSSESGMSSPKPAANKFKGWNLTTETGNGDNGQRGDNATGEGWCPWSTTAFVSEMSNDNGGEEDEWISRDELEPNPNRPKIDFNFEPLPSLAIGRGIWSNSASKSAESGW